MCRRTAYSWSGWRTSKVLVTSDRSLSGEISGPVDTPDSVSSSGSSPGSAPARNGELTGKERIDLANLAPGTCLELKTRHNSYTLQYLGEGRVEICGHPQYCPVPTVVKLEGSSLGVGLRFEFHHPAHSLVTTSRIIALRRVG
jgi:hypothetical protein